MYNVVENSFPWGNCFPYQLRMKLSIWFHWTVNFYVHQSTFKLQCHAAHQKITIPSSKMFLPLEGSETQLLRLIMQSEYIQQINNKVMSPSWWITSSLQSVNKVKIFINVTLKLQQIFILLMNCIVYKISEYSVKCSQSSKLSKSDTHCSTNSPKPIMFKLKIESLNILVSEIHLSLAFYLKDSLIIKIVVNELSDLPNCSFVISFKQ